MIALQRFKENDEIETKMIATTMPSLNTLGTDRDTMFNEAFLAYPLGDVLYDLGRDPIVGIIPKAIYRTSFPEIHQMFTRPGTFEFYLDLFRAIYGDDVEIVFAVPEPGLLTINVEALDIYSFDFVAREVVEDEYEYNPIITQDDEFLQFLDTTGLKNQAEIDALLNELTPHGITVVTTLTL